MEGRGGATITEVSFLTKQLSPEEESSHTAREKEFKGRLDAAKRRRDVLWTKKHRLKKQRDVLDGFADNVMRAGSRPNRPVSEGEDPVPVVVDIKLLGSLFALVTIQGLCYSSSK